MDRVIPSSLDDIYGPGADAAAYDDTSPWPVSDAKIWGLFHVNCIKCGKPLSIHVDVSCGPPSEAGTECLNCGAVPIYRVNWWYEVALEALVRDDSVPSDNLL